MASILLVGPNGQKVYSDPSSSDHAGYLAGGFKPTTSTGASSTQNPNTQGQLNALASKSTATPTPTQQPAQSYSAPKAPTNASTYTPPAQTTQPQTSSAPRIDLSSYGTKSSNTGVLTNVDWNRVNMDYENVTSVGNPDQGGYYTGTAIPKATLISPNGQRVVVRTDGKSSPGLPSADEYFKQGFVLEKTPGVYDSGSSKATFATSQQTPVAPKPPSLPTATASGAGSAGIPPGYVRIPGTYSTSAAQKAAFDDIQVSGTPGQPGSFLYGKPKDGSSGSGQTPTPPPTINESSSLPSADPVLQSILQGFLKSPVTSQEDLSKYLGQSGKTGMDEKQVTDEINKYFLERDKQLQALQDAYYKDSMPTQEETDTQKSLDDLISQQSNINSSKELGINEIKKQPIAMGFLSGQSAAVERDAATKIGALTSQSEPLKAKLAALQAKRTAALNVDKERITAEQQSMKDLMEQMKPISAGDSLVRYNPITKQYETVYSGAKSAAPVSVAPGNALVNPSTGEVIYQSAAKDSASQTNDIKEYEYAKSQGYKGGFQDWLKLAANLKDQANGTGFKNETDLRKEFNGLDVVQQYNSIKRYFTSMNSALNEALSKGDMQSKAAADQALVTLFNKLLDPTSVVREGEYARSMEGQSALSVAVGYLEKLRQGGAGLTDMNRAEMVQTAQRLYEDAKNMYDQNAGFYSNIAQNYGLNPERVIMGGDTGFTSSNGLSSLQPGGLDAQIQSTSTTYNVPTNEIQDALNRGVSMQQIIEYLKKEQALTTPAGVVGAGAVTHTNGLNTDIRTLANDVVTTGSGFRTDRHNNPTAFTTDIARLAGLREGVDYVTGDAFPNNPNLKTARLLGDPISTTIRVIDKIGFQTASGKPRWDYINLPKAQWTAMSYADKKKVIANMYAHEGGNKLVI